MIFYKTFQFLEKCEVTLQSSLISYEIIDEFIKLFERAVADPKFLTQLGID